MNKVYENLETLRRIAKTLPDGAYQYKFGNQIKTVIISGGVITGLQG